MTDNALPASPAFQIEQELRAFDAENQLDTENQADPIASVSEYPADGLLSNTPAEAGAPIEDTYPANPVFESFSTAMQDYGIQAERLADARTWLDKLPDLGDLTGQRIEHGYDVKGYLDSFESQDQAILHNFLNHASASGWEQEDVNNAIAWYLDAFSDTGQSPDDVMAVQAERDIEALDKQDRDQARGKLKEIWSEEFDANIALANQHLDRLPASQREYLEGSGPDGRLRLNDPEILSKLAQESRSQIPQVLTEAAKQHGSERAALEDMMANRSSPYWRGADAAALQARYRDLISSGDTGAAKPLPQGNGIAQEIAAIENVMRTDRYRYNKDEGMQQRYRQLLELTGG